MTGYVIRRLALIIPTLFLVTIIVFLLVRFIPGDIIELMVAEMSAEGTVTTEITAETIRTALGMDVPVHTQYGKWLGGVFRGDLGDSLWTGRAITVELGNRIPISFELGLLAIITALLIAIPIGVYSAIRQDTAGDYLGRTFAILCISLPGFWLGTMVVVYPSIWWNWSPPLDYIPIVENPIENLKQFIIPAVLMGMVMSGTTMRMTRTMMLEVLRQDYIRTAWSKGLMERVVVVRHAMKNALIPVVTIAAGMLPVLIGGTVVFESIFALPGVGLYMIEALNKRDYPIISGINVIMGMLVLVLNLVVDLTYAWLDPRVRYR
ncbi:MAG: ABC transporter permease [Dehalococcoidales bacterium]|nr:MAG: ABC transporter permease [Dehalococcoidales bacterium]